MANQKMFIYRLYNNKYYSKDGGIKTIIIGCLKANRKNACLFSNLRGPKLI